MKSIFSNKGIFRSPLLLNGASCIHLQFPSDAKVKYALSLTSDILHKILPSNRDDFENKVLIHSVLY